MKKDQLKERRRKKILDAALKCFNERGYYETTMDLIAKKAHITKRGLYFYFKSKDELFIEIFNFSGSNFFKQISTYIKENNSLEERLLLFVTKGGSVLKENEDFMRFMVEFMSVGARKPEVRMVMTKYYKEHLENFKHVLQAGITSGKFKEHNIDKVARAMFMISMGIFYTFYSLDKDFDLVDQHIFDMKQIFESINKKQDFANN